jgi:hypothetical protein
MNTDTDESDCIVVDPGGGDVGRRGAGLPASPDPAGAAASAEVGKAAVEEGEGGEWIRVIRQRAKGNTRASTSEPAAKPVKVFTSTGELERKRKAEDGTTEQVTQLKELVC